MQAIIYGISSCLMVLGAGVIYSYATNDWNHMINFGGISIFAGAATTLLGTMLEKE